MRLRTKLRDYQRSGVEALKSFHGRALLADQMGLGKSIQVLAYLNEEGLKRTIVVCPAAAKWVWDHEAWKHLGARVEVMSGRSPKKGGLPKLSKIVVANYDILKARIEELSDWRPELVVFDEAHYLQSRGAQRTKAAKLLAREAEKVICVTGTPIVNRPAELWPILNIILPKSYPTFFPFARAYCRPRKAPWGWVYDGASNLEELHGTLKKTCLIRRLKKDVLKDLPSKQRVVVPLPIERYKEYAAARDDLRGWILRNSPEKLIGALRAEGLVRFGYLKQLAAKLKLKAALQWCDDFLLQEDKLIVFATHIAIVEAVAAHYGKRAVMVNGSVTDKKREAAFYAFNNNSSVKVFSGNIRAAGTAWSCTSASSVVKLELDWSPGVHAQAEDRVHGLSRGVEGVASSAYYLVGRGTVEEALCKMIQRKQNTLNALIDGGAGEEIELYAELCEAVRRGEA